VPMDRHGHLKCAMAQHLHDDPGRHPLSEQHRGAGVPEIAQPRLPNAGPFA
jgi:hypothetical protein